MMRALLGLVAMSAVSCSGGAARRPAPDPTAKTTATSTGVPAPPATPLHIDVVRPPRTSSAAPAPILELATKELARSVGELKKHADPPYFASYEITDSRRVDVSASGGVLLSSSDTRARWVDVDVRAGDHKLDNTHRGRARREGGGFWAALPLEDD